MKQIKFMNTEEVKSELREIGAEFSDSAELKELKDQLKEIRNRKDEPVAGIKENESPKPQNAPSKAPASQNDVRVPLETPKPSEGDSKVLMRYMGGAASYRIGKHVVTDKDPFTLVEPDEVERMKGKQFVEVSDDQMKAFYA